MGGLETRVGLFIRKQHWTGKTLVYYKSVREKGPEKVFCGACEDAV